MIKKDYIEGNYRIIEYENGSIIKELLSKGSPNEGQITIPPSPLEVLKIENNQLKGELESTKLALAETVEKQERDKTELQLAMAQMIENGGIING